MITGLAGPRNIGAQRTRTEACFLSSKVVAPLMSNVRRTSECSADWLVQRNKAGRIIATIDLTAPFAARHVHQEADWALYRATQGQQRPGATPAAQPEPSASERPMDSATSEVRGQAGSRDVRP